jgi:hypothetical protein
MTQTKFSHVTPATIRHALCIDFEGQTDQPPVLLGSARRNGTGGYLPVWQCVTDPTFEPLAARGGMEVLDLHAAVVRILQRAEKNDRQIVAWSNHELDVVREYCPDLLERFEARYVNARTFAEYWRNKCHDRDKPDVATLANYLRLIGHEVPVEYGPGKVGETIRRIRNAVEKGQGIAGLTADQLRRWEDLRAHNRHDCVGMRKVCLRAAGEIETFEARSVSRPSVSPRSRRRRARGREGAESRRAAAVT